MSKNSASHKEAQRLRHARRRAEWFDGKICAWCHSTESLELDHVDPSLKVANSIWNWSDDRIAIETSKCQVLCHDCHVIKTNLNGDKPIKSNLDQVIEIRQLYLDGVSMRGLAIKYGLAVSTIHDIVHRKTWKFI